MTKYTDPKLEERVLAGALAQQDCAEQLQRRRLGTRNLYSLFDTEVADTAAEAIFAYWQMYGVAPTTDALRMFLNGSGAAIRMVVEQALKIPAPGDNFPAFLDQLAHLAIVRASSTVVLQFAKVLDEKQVDGVEILQHQLAEILSTRHLGQNVIEGGDWQEESEQWVESYRQHRDRQSTHQINLNLGSVGEKIGGASYGETLCLYGGVNQGKSFLLGHLAWEMFAKQGLHVVHLTLETAKRFVDWRYASRALYDLMGEEAPGFNDFRGGRISETQLKWIQAYVDKGVESPGSLYVLDIPEEYANVDMVTSLVKERRKGRPVDAIVVDYSTLMRLRQQGRRGSLDWDVLAELSKELRDNLARSRYLTNSAGDKGVFLLTAGQTNPQQTVKKSPNAFAKTVQATDVGFSYAVAQPIDYGVHLRKEKAEDFWGHADMQGVIPEALPPDLLLLVLSKSRYTGGAGVRSWFRPNWENWFLGDPLSSEEVANALGGMIE